MTLSAYPFFSQPIKFKYVDGQTKQIPHQLQALAMNMLIPLKKHPFLPISAVPTVSANETCANPIYAQIYNATIEDAGYALMEALSPIFTCTCSGKLGIPSVHIRGRPHNIFIEKKHKIPSFEITIIYDDKTNYSCNNKNILCAYIHVSNISDIATIVLRQKCEHIFCTMIEL